MFRVISFKNNLGIKKFSIGEGGESTLWGGHFGHLHNMYVKYIFAKCITFNFGFDFLIFTNLMISNVIWISFL